MFESSISLNAYDVEAWQSLLARVSSWPIDRARVIYERFLSIFPSSARYWNTWIQCELAANEFGRCDALFQRCLYAVPSIELWLAYIRYAHAMNSGSPNEHATMEAVYEDALNHMSADIQVPIIYTAYIQFLGTLPATSNYEETQRMQKQRRVFQRAVVCPGIGVDDLWREWDRFEHNVNKTLAIGLLSEVNPRHLQAKQVSRERRRRWRLIRHDILAQPPTSSNAALFAQQNTLWRELIEYELTNPMHGSPVELHATLSFTYRQALLTLNHDVYMQHEFLSYLSSLALTLGSLTEEIIKRWQDARAMCSYSMLLTFSNAELLESQGNLKEARNVYETTIEQRMQQAVAQSTSTVDTMIEQCEETEQQVRRTIVWTEAEKHALYGTSPDTKSETPVAVENDDDKAKLAAVNAEIQAATSRNVTLLFIQFMRFARRTEGPDAARKVFLLARRSKVPVLSHCYTFASLLDYRVNKNAEFASKIFQSGLDKFQSDSNYLDSYLRYLLAINDHSNLRLVIERTVKEGEKIGMELKQKLEDEKLKDRVKRKRGPESAAPVPAPSTVLTPAQAALLNQNSPSLWDFGCLSAEEDVPSTLFFEPQSSIVSFMDTVPRANHNLGMVWRTYVEVERWLASEVATIEKAELRREVALGLTSPTIARLTDRFRFQDVWPTSQAQRMLIAYSVSPPSNATATAAKAAAQVTSQTDATDFQSRRRAAHPRPNTTAPNMISFDSSRPMIDRGLLVARYGSSLPDSIIHTLIRLPPPLNWQGPIYPVESVITQLSISYPERDQLVASTATTPAIAESSSPSHSVSEKRKREEGSPDEGDLFKQRRQQKLRTA